MIETENIGGRKCHIYRGNPNAPYIYWGIQPHTSNEAEKMKEYMDKAAEKLSYNLIAFEPEDWNADFSPWAAPAVFGKEDFSGKAMETGEWLTKVCIPQVEGTKKPEERVRFIAGYSLAGLFALWIFLESGLFLGAASCSGSLWYPGFLDYIRKAKMPENSIVYLSLGTKEEKTKNPVMAAVGSVTREIAELLEKKPEIADSILEWNPGGHFQEPLERTGKGIVWMLEKARIRKNKCS